MFEFLQDPESQLSEEEKMRRAANEQRVPRPQGTSAAVAKNFSAEEQRASAQDRAAVDARVAARDASLTPAQRGQIGAIQAFQETDLGQLLLPKNLFGEFGKGGQRGQPQPPAAVQPKQQPQQQGSPDAQDMSILGIQPDAAAIDPNPANRQTSALNMLGNKNYEMLFDVMEDIGGKTGRRSDQPAYGPAALEYVVRNAQTMGLITPEMAGAFALQLKALSGLDTPEKKAASVEGSRSYQSGEEAKQVEGQIDEKRKEHKNKVQELFEAEELQSWGSILAYVVMSLFIGPRMAFLFFSNAQKKGMLKYELEQIKADGRRLSEAKALKEREAREARANAANLMLRGEVKQDDRRWQAMREQMAREEQHANRLVEIEARAAASGRKDADFENLKTKIKGYENQARLAASRFDFEASEAYAEAAADLLQRIETAYGEK